MGDRTYTSIKFSGEITCAVAEELLQDLEGQGCRCDLDDGAEELTIEHLLMPHVLFYDGECNYAQMEGVEDTCREHGIAYLKAWEPGGGYGAGMQLFNGTKELDVGTVEGEPALTFNQIKELGIEMLGFLDLFENFDKHFPPLTIVGDKREAA